MTVARSLRQIVVVARKEIKDSLRDRRALWSIVFSVSIGPLIIGFMMNRVADRQRESEHVRVPVVGMQNAPALVEWLRQQSGVDVVEGPQDAEAAVRNQEEELAIIIPKNFAERFNQSRPAPLQIVADSSRNDARPTIERVRRLLQQYSAEIGSLRLIARGVSPAVGQPLDLEDIEVSTAQQRAAQILTFIPMFIIMAGFVGGMQIATDSTAGERERGSLAPLLVNPAPRLARENSRWPRWRARRSPPSCARTCQGSCRSKKWASGSGSDPSTSAGSPARRCRCVCSRRHCRPRSRRWRDRSRKPRATWACWCCCR